MAYTELDGAIAGATSVAELTHEAGNGIEWEDGI